MDRNQIIGMVLMLILMTVYFQFFSPDLPEPVIGKTTIEQSIENKNNANQAVGQSNNATLNQSTDSLLTAMNNEKYGVFAAFAEGAEETFNIENDDIVATFSTKGGQIKKLVLKGHLTFEKKPLVLIDEQSSALDIWIKSNYKPINLSDLNFSTGRTGTKVTGTDTLNFSFKISLDGNRFVEQQYTIPGAWHVIGYKLKMSGLDGIVDNEDVLINWINKMKVYEDNLTASRAETTINYYTALEGMDDLSATSNDKESEEIVTQVNWLAFHQKFFTSAIIAENNFRSVAISIEFDELDSTVVKIGEMNLTVSMADIKAEDGQFKFYYGPNNYGILKGVAPDFDENVDWGWSVFRSINIFLISPIFNFLQEYISNYGVIILLMVILIKILLLPLTYKSHMSMAKMKVLKP